MAYNDIPTSPEEQKLFEKRIAAAKIDNLVMDYDPEDEDHYLSGYIGTTKILWQLRGFKSCYLEIIFPNKDRYQPEITPPIEAKLDKWVEELKEKKLMGKTLLEKIKKWF